MKIVKVTWLDSESRGAGWISKDDFDEFASDPIPPCVSVGILWTDAPDHIVLVLNVSKDCVDGHTKIPKVAIVDTEELGEVDVTSPDQ